MLTPRPGEGGTEIHDVMPDVTYAPGIILPRVAYNAARTAMRFCQQSDDLPFVTRVDSTTYRVGTYSPAHYNDVRGTLFGHRGQQQRAGSFIRACKALDRFAGMEGDMGWVYVMHIEGDQILPPHRDEYEGARSLVQLAGFKSVSFYHDQPVPATTDLVMGPAEAYRMQFRGDESSVAHGVVYIGSPSNVALYVDY